ncbi:MAG: phosphopantetheine-binding protein [Nitrospiraceae bacterium]
MSTPAEKPVESHRTCESDVARLVVETLKLEILPEDIDHSAPLFGEGLGLDSIDMLEIALCVSKKYGCELRSEDRAAFTSIHALTAHITRHRTR